MRMDVLEEGKMVGSEVESAVGGPCVVPFRIARAQAPWHVIHRIHATAVMAAHCTHEADLCPQTQSLGTTTDVKRPAIVPLRGERQPGIPGACIKKNSDNGNGSTT